MPIARIIPQDDALEFRCPAIRGLVWKLGTFAAQRETVDKAFRYLQLALVGRR